MEHFYRTLILQSLGDADLPIDPAQGRDLSLDSPAVDVLLDFRRSKPLVLELDTKVDDANALMKKAHVDLKQVVDKDDHFVGIVTKRRLGGQNILRTVNVTGIPRPDLTVEDVMIRRAVLQAITPAQLDSSTIGDVVETLRETGEEFIMVVDASGTAICGVFSAEQIARELHTSIEDPMRATSMADINEALEHQIS